jgi:hypothetical protein
MVSVENKNMEQLILDRIRKVQERVPGSIGDILQYKLVRCDDENKTYYLPCLANCEYLKLLQYKTESYKKNNYEFNYGKNEYRAPCVRKLFHKIGEKIDEKHEGYDIIKYSLSDARKGKKDYTET